MGDAHAGTPGGRLEFGMMNDWKSSTKHPLATRTLNSNCRAAAIAHHSFAIRHRRFAAGLLRLREVVHKIAVLHTKFLNGFESVPKVGLLHNRRPSDAIGHR